jgi:hypothetical protein
VTETIPRPRAATGVVFADTAARTLTVRLSESESGYMRLCWKEGWQALRAAEEEGWPASGPPTVYCDVPGGRRVVHGVPVEGGALSFRFLPGVAGSGELVGKPNLTAITTLDIATRHILSVRFLHGPAAA